MRITIHRGADQIGGTITEYEHNGWRLFVDFGEQLPGAPISDLPDFEGLTKGDFSKTAVLVTHYHGDHIGNIHHIPDDIPVYMGALGIEIQKITSGRLKNIDKKHASLLERLNRAKIFRADITFEFGPFRILPIVIDHSAFDAYAFRIEADSIKIFHTGDFRMHGFRGKKLLNVIDNIIGKVDYVVCEGTNIIRPDVTLQSESELQRLMEKDFKQHKFNIVYLSSTNIDRLFSIYHAALKIGMPFLVDYYQKDIMDVVVEKEQIWTKSILYRYGSRMPMVLKYDKENPGEYFTNKKFISYLEQKGYVLIARSNPSFDRLIERLPGEPKQCYLSMWEGYVNDPSSPSYNVNLASSLGKGYIYRHTSGHCDIKSLHNLFTKLSPKAIIPIHTDSPNSFVAIFNNQWKIVLMQDGNTINLQ